MKTENKIDNYFEQVKQNPPLIPIEKVHQIITSPEAMARLKGKPNNLTKYIIMTTIFAVIISAVLFWPNEDVSSNSYPEQVVSSKTEVPNTIEAQISDKLGEIVVNKSQINDPKNSSRNTLEVEVQDVNSKRSGVISHKETNQNNQLNNVATAIASNIEQTDFEPDALQPIDGSRFILRLTDEELEKIGFEVTDTSYRYRQIVGRTVFSYYYEIKREKYQSSIKSSKTLTAKFDNDTLLTVGHTEWGFGGYHRENKVENDKFDFYPAFKSNLFYSALEGCGKVENKDFSMANDTLIPIVLPVSKLNKKAEDQLFWFTTSENFYAVLSPKHRAVLDEFKKYKAAKKAFSTKDLVVYQPKKLFDESKVLVLSKQALIKLGFEFYVDSTVYKGNSRTSDVAYCRSISSSKSTCFSGLTLVKYTNLLAVMITRTDGSPYANFNIPIENLEIESGKYGSQFPLLIPVLVKSKESLFSEDVIFWFYPTPELFEALPINISTDLRKEYNYIMAENKSALVKPVCKYFDECVNTLEISNFKVSPNPAKSNVTVSFTLPEAIEGRITLVDLSGRERQVLKPSTIYSKGQQTVEINISNVPEGIYLLTLFSDKGIQTQRLIVTR